MPTFTYRGRNAKGQAVQGHLDGADPGAVADQLFRTGVTPIEIIAAAGGGGVGLNLAGMFKRQRDNVTHAELILFSRQMFTLSKAGVPMLRALAGLQESATNPGLAHVLQEMRSSLDSGHELSAAICDANRSKICSIDSSAPRNGAQLCTPHPPRATCFRARLTFVKGGAKRLLSL